MNEQSDAISRDELYQRLWTTPIVRLAQELGYSYPELIKICVGLQIPRPTGGYWYRVQHGGCSEQVALPPAPIGVQTMIPFGPRLNAASPPEPEPTEPHAVVREENPSTTAATAEVQSSRATAPAADNASAAAAQKRKNATRIPEAGPPAAEVPAPTFPDVVEMGRVELYRLGADEGVAAQTNRKSHGI